MSRKRVAAVRRARPARRTGAALAAALAAAALAGCDRTLGPLGGAPAPAAVPMIGLAAALDVIGFVDDERLRADPQAACSHAPLVGADGRIINHPFIAARRVAATRLPDGSLLRMRGGVSAVLRPPVQFEVMRTWPDGSGLLVASYDLRGDSLWELRHAPGGRDRVTYERMIRDASAAAMLVAIWRRFAELDCLPALSRAVDHGEQLVPLWVGTPSEFAGFAWRHQWPQRPPFPR